MTTQLGPIEIQLTAKGVSETIREMQNLVDRIAALEAKQTATTKKNYTEQERAAKKAAKEKEKAARDAAREAEKAGKQVEREAKKAADAEIRETKRAYNEMAREWKRGADFREREERRAADAAIRESKRANAARAQYTRQISGRATGALSSGLGLVGRIAGAGLALGGGLSVGGALQHELQIQRSAAALSVASRVPGQKEISTRDAIDRARTISQQYNVDENDVLGGLHSFVAKTGNVSLASGVMSSVAKVSKAEGVDLSDLASSLATAAAQNPNLGQNELVELMKILVAQGKEGSVEIKDLAHVLPVAIAKAVEFEGNQGDNQVKLASLAQVAIKATGSPEEAATAIKNLPTDITKHEKEFRANGINVRGAGGKIRDVNKILSETIGKTGGNAFKLEKLFGERAGAIANALVPVYSTAENAKKGSGQAAVYDELVRRNEQRLTDAQIDHDLQTVASTDAENLSKVMNDLQREVGTKLVPQLIKLVPIVAELTPHFVTLLSGIAALAEFISHHPWASLFTGLGMKISSAIVSEVASSKLKGGGAAGAALSALTITSLAVTTATIGMAIIDKWSDDAADKQRKDVATMINTENLINKAHAAPGTFTGDEKDAFAKQLVADRARLASEITKTESTMETENRNKAIGQGNGPSAAELQHYKELTDSMLRVSESIDLLNTSVSHPNGFIGPLPPSPGPRSETGSGFSGGGKSSGGGSDSF